MTIAEALRLIEQEGMILESARGSVPSLAQRVTGSLIRGSWWAHADASRIFALSRAVRRSPDVLVCRLIQGKITLVHKRLWPALVRVADRFPRDRLAAIEEIHTKQGKHAKRETAFPDWVPQAVLEEARRLDVDAALAMLRPMVRVSEQASATGSSSGLD